MSATVNVAELIVGRSAEMNERGSPVSASRQYQIVRPFANAEFTLAGVTGLPAANAAHPVYTRLFVKRYALSEADPLRWIVTVEYEAKSGAAGDGSTYFRIRRSWGVAEGQRDLSFDSVSGALIKNSAGDPFDSTTTVPVSGLEITIVVLSSTSPASILANNGTTNSGSVTVAGITFAADTARLKVTCKETEGDFAYEYTYVVTQRINYALVSGSVADIGWKEAFVDQGYRILDGSTLKNIMIEDEDTGEKRPANVPSLLNGSGALLTTGNPVSIVVYAHPRASWSGLPLN